MSKRPAKTTITVPADQVRRPRVRTIAGVKVHDAHKSSHRYRRRADKRNGYGDDS